MNDRQYLELMGIEVWQKRRPKAAPAPETVSVEERVANQVALGSSRSGESGIADLKRSLGSDPANQRTEPKLEVIASAPKQETVEPSGDPAPEFLLTLSHFSTLSIINLYPIDFATIPGNHQRFITTFFHGVSGKKEQSNVSEFRWPMVKSSRISQSRQEAQQVLGRHLEQCAPEVLIFGSEASDLMGAGEVEIYSQAKIRNRQVTVAADIELYFRTPTQRRLLWHGVKGLRDRCRPSP